MAADRSIERQNRSHQHFLDNLKFINGILKGNMGPKATKIAASAHSTSTKESNVYELLEVEYVEGEDTPSSVSDRQQPEPNIPDTGPSRTPASDADWLFEAFCTFDDFENIRTYVFGLWEEHRSGKIDFVVASMITEICFQVMERLEQDTLYPCVDGEHLNPLQLGASIFRSIEIAHGVRHSEPVEEPMWSVGEWLGLSIQQSVKQWTTGSPPLKAKMYERFGMYDSHADWFAKSKMCLSSLPHEERILREFQSSWHRRIQ
jgi:hypothetical protein